MGSLGECWCGAFGQRSDVLSTRCDTVVPQHAASGKSPATATQLAKAETAGFSVAPLACASFPAIALRLRGADPELLQASLALALARHRELAGRIRGTAVELSDEGVPFAVVESSLPSAPTPIREPDLLRFADFRRAIRVSAGLEPPMTVRLTRFRDGSAVLAICRSHVLMDGTSAWAFIGDWARAARGEEMIAGRASGLEEGLPGRAEVDALFVERFGEPLRARFASTKMALVRSIMRVAGPPVDLLFLTGSTADLERPRVFFSDADIAALKAAATPSTPGSWVSTQEAIAAYLVLTVGRALLPASSKGRVAIAYILDPRKAIGRSATETFGCGLAVVSLTFEGLLQLSLPEIAGKLHEAAQTEMSLKEAGQRWRMMGGCVKDGIEFALMNKIMPKKWEYDVALTLNNQSKRELPNFGAAGGGCSAESFVTNAGPTVMLPAAGGIDVLLDPTTILRQAKSARARAAAVKAIVEGKPAA